jgi:repressor LexA
MNNLRAARKKKGLTQAEVANFIGIGQSGYSDWERGKTSRIDPNSLAQLSQLLGVTVDYILGDESLPTTPTGIRIPVLGSIPAGIPLEAVEDIDDWEEIPQSMCSGGKEYFALKVQGDSMWPDYLPGDVVIIRKDSSCESGDVCVVYVNGYDATLKQVKLGEYGSLSIIPKNQSYAPRTYTKEEVVDLPVSIAGVVVELRRKIKK